MEVEIGIVNISDAVTGLRRRIEESKENDLETTLEVKFQFLNDEFEIRIESLKIEIDQLNVDLQKKVNRLQKRMLRLNEPSLRSKLLLLKEKSRSPTETIVKVDKLNAVTKKIQNIVKGIFTLSTDSISDVQIGVLTTYDKIHEEIKEKLRKGKAEQIELNRRPFEICLLPNDTFLVVSYEYLTVYNKNFEIVQPSQTGIESKYDEILFVATNDKDRIFLSCVDKDQIIVTDLDLNKIQVIGTSGSNSGEFHDPYGLFYYKDNLFVCDSSNARIQLFNENYVFIKEHSLDFMPWQIKISSSDIACIRPEDIDFIMFYDLKTFNLIIKYESHRGTINMIDSYFYEYDSESQLFYCYTPRGALVEKIQNEESKLDLTSNYDGHITYFNGNVLISSFSLKALFKL